MNLDKYKATVCICFVMVINNLLLSIKQALYDTFNQWSPFCAESVRVRMQKFWHEHCMHVDYTRLFVTTDSDGESKKAVGCHMKITEIGWRMNQHIFVCYLYSRYPKIETNNAIITFCYSKEFWCKTSLPNTSPDPFCHC